MSKGYKNFNFEDQIKKLNEARINEAVNNMVMLNMFRLGEHLELVTFVKSAVRSFLTLNQNPYEEIQDTILQYRLTLKELDPTYTGYTLEELLQTDYSMTTINELIRIKEEINL